MNPSRFADRIFEGGTLLTMNEHQPTAEALALQDGHILAVGTRAEVLALRGPDTEIVPLQGGTVIPAVVDKLSNNNNSNAEEEEPEPQGTLAPGQRANFVVLSGNPLVVTPRAREDLRVLHVVKDGRSLYFADTPPAREKKDEEPFNEALFLDESGWLV
ncbi:amidohydrolase family protein [Myxococcus qinghaiensis]|uniref:amidohydrolase family protein n=1 Tax=Myxococcus qinghaiensis TaxID=2906758 RepID=UPI0020A7B810|nr:amidohydrolase family protein [Myxococcus qinghaiensis]MCP3168953.1 amidohydrolase family protein [Myxococcus qinghaiensis]